jgi:pimeloyl-ACP methyl ester carboxylesterase
MKTLGKALVAVPALALAAYSAACALLAWNARAMLYHPAARTADTPTWTLQRDDTRLVVSHNDHSSDHAVLYFGGNAEDASQAVLRLRSAFPASSIHALHYRGYGGSGGDPSEQDLVADALAFYDALAPRHLQLTLIGRSLGSGIAIQVAAARASDQLLLITPYNSIAELGQQRFPMFPVRWLLRDRYESWRYAPMIHTPTTIVIAGKDQVIPNDSSYRLVAQFPAGVARVVTLDDADHGSAPLWQAVTR